MRNLVKTLLSLICLTLCVFLQATAQTPDYLILNGKKVSLHSNPLERFFESHPERSPKSEITSTACWRGYVATFEIKEGRFLVNKITVLIKDPKAPAKEFRTIEKDVTKTVFEDPNEPFCDWYTGAVIIPEGEVVNYVHMGYASTFERYTVLTVVKGIQTSIKSFSAKEFTEYRVAQFAAYKKTPRYKQELAQALKEGGNEEDVERFLFEFSSEYYLSQDFSKPAN